MSLFQQVQGKIKKYQAESDKRELERISRLTTKTEQMRAKSKLKVEQLKIKKELKEAETALRKAKVANKKVAKETGDSLAALLGSLGKKTGKGIVAYRKWAKKGEKPARPRRKATKRLTRHKTTKKVSKSKVVTIAGKRFIQVD